MRWTIWFTLLDEILDLDYWDELFDLHYWDEVLDLDYWDELLDLDYWYESSTWFRLLRWTWSQIIEIK